MAMAPCHGTTSPMINSKEIVRNVKQCPYCKGPVDKQPGYGYFLCRNDTECGAYGDPLLGIMEEGRPSIRRRYALYELCTHVQKALTPDLLKQPYRKQVEEGAHPHTGHCYVACEAVFHLSPFKLTPCSIQHEETTHWFLRDSIGNIIDPTKEQFATPVPYGLGRGRGFLTREPSKRAQIVLERIQK